MDLTAWLAAIIATLAIAWLVLVLILWRNRPSRELAAVALRLLPEVLRLTGRTIVDPATPRSAKAALVLLGAWLAMPLDLIPDFLPIIGQLDDIVVAIVVLRWVGRRVGHERLKSHWSGSEEGWGLLMRALGWGVSETAPQD